MSPYAKLGYLFLLLCIMMLHIEIEASINLGCFIWDPLLLTMPGLIVGWLYIIGEIVENYMKHRGAVLYSPANEN